jgi:hypothetical protein
MASSELKFSERLREDKSQLQEIQKATNDVSQVFSSTLHGKGVD